MPGEGEPVADLPVLDPRRPPAGARRLLVPGLALSVSVAYGALFYAFSVLVTEEAAGAAFSSTVLSAAFGGAVLTGGAAAVAVGRLADRRGVRALVAVGSLLGGAGLAGFAAARQPWQVLAVWWVVLGPAMAATFYETAYVAIDQWVPPERRLRALATLTLLAGLSGPVSVPLAGALVGALGWRAATAVLGAGLAGTGVAVAAVALPGAPPDRRGPAGSTEPPPAVGGDRRFVVFTVACVLAYGSLEALVVHRVARFEEAGFALGTVTAWTAASGLLTIPGRLALPSLAARVPGTAVLAGIWATLAAAAVLAVGGHSSWAMAGHFGLFGLVFGAAAPLRAVVVAGWYSGPGYGRVMGLQAAAVAVGRAGGPALTGALRDATSGYGAPVALLAAALAAAAVLTAAAPSAGGGRTAGGTPAPG